MRRTLVVANRTLGGEHLASELEARMRAGPAAFFVLVPASHTDDGAVGDANPVLAIADLVRDREFDEILLSTLPPGPSRWLRQDLPHRVERRFGLPVTHVVAVPEPA